MIVVESADISHIRENQMPYNQDYLWSVHISVWRGFFLTEKQKPRSMTERVQIPPAVK